MTAHRLAKGTILDNFLIAVLVVCASDLLYLYFMGAWRCYIKAIEYSEVVALVLLAVIGTIRIIYKFKEAK